MRQIATAECYDDGDNDDNDIIFVVQEVCVQLESKSTAYTLDTDHPEGTEIKSELQM